MNSLWWIIGFVMIYMVLGTKRTGVLLFSSLFFAILASDMAADAATAIGLGMGLVTTAVKGWPRRRLNMQQPLG